MDYLNDLQIALKRLETEASDWRSTPSPRSRLDS